MNIRTAAIFLSIFATGCQTAMEAVNKTAGTVADKITPTNIVTGERKLGLQSIEKSFQKAEEIHEELISSLKADTEKGELIIALLTADSEYLSKVGEDTEKIQWHLSQYSRVTRIIKRLAQASHYPDIDWVVHVIPIQVPNAFTTGGRHIYIYWGLFGENGLVAENDDNELAAVLAHEMGHAVGGHRGEDEGLKMLSRVSKRAKGIAGDEIAAASFSTEQEDEADKIGILYMSLAGFDPEATPRFWQRAHEKRGSNPGDFTYDHSLPADRAAKTRSLAEKVRPYYTESKDTIHPNVKTLLSDNILFRRHVETSGFLALLESAADLTVKYHKTKNEAENRRRQQEVENSIPKNRPVYITNSTSLTLYVFADFYILDESGELIYDRGGSEGKYFIVPPDFSGVLGTDKANLAASADVWAHSKDGRYKWKSMPLGMDGNRRLTNNKMQVNFTIGEK